ncbi:MAG: DUF2802 domain-containing protein [Colwelliaceae bacterium]|nr:DUF2802 domain-containing protein [Colwelliaceae bacterium]
MDINIIFSIAVITVIFALYIYILLIKKKFTNQFNALETQIESYEFIINELRLANQQQQSQLTSKENELQTWQLEHQQVSQQLEHRIKIQQDKLSSLSEEISQIQQVQPEDKLYSRAQKMVLLGADVEELVRECDLPQAEAEILLAMHKRKKS